MLEMTEDLHEKTGDLWPGRYEVGAKVETWERRGLLFRNQHLTLLHSNMSDEETKELLEPLGFTPDLDDYLYIASQAEQTFTEEQANELIAYLENFEGTEAYKTPATKPVPGHAGVSVLPIGGDTDIYLLYKHDKYNLSFNAEAFYRVDWEEGRPTAEAWKNELKSLFVNSSADEIREVKTWLDELINEKNREFERIK